MKIDNVVAKLVNLYAVRSFNIVKQPFLVGPPGIGKSFTIEQAAREIAKREKKEYIKYDDDHANQILANPDKFFVFVDLRLTEVEPSDLSGIPRDRDDVDAVHFKPLLWARCLSKAAGILLLDELTKDL